MPDCESHTRSAMKLTTCVALPLLAACVSCAEPLAPPVALLQTDAQAYTLSSTPPGNRVTIGLQLTNTGRMPVLIGNCRGDFPAHLEKLEGSNWVVAWSGVWLMCASAPIIVMPGMQHDALLHVDYSKWHTADIAGQYRVVAETLSDGHSVLPLELRSSNPFTISVPAQ